MIYEGCIHYWFQILDCFLPVIIFGKFYFDTCGTNLSLIIVCSVCYK